MKILKIVLSIIFLLFAIVQYNDPDPLLWMFIYSYVSLLFVLSLFSSISRTLVIASIVALTSYSLFYLPGLIEWLSTGSISELTESMKADKNYIEESREFLGLLISVGALFIILKTKKQ